VSQNLRLATTGEQLVSLQPTRGVVAAGAS
jgi:hypothetical protein